MSNPQEPSIKGKVYFYPPEYYVFDNFSSFQVQYKGKMYPTSEHAYQSSKFINTNKELAEKIRNAKSAHEAYKIAQANKDKIEENWDEKKIELMKDILHCKASQHEYVMRKILQSGDRVIIEDSWRDNYWGWGEDRKGKNMLGKLWMEVRKEIRDKE